MGYGRGLECECNILIAAENVSKSRYKTSVHEESSIKLMKNASICRSPEKNRVFGNLA